MHPKEVRKGSIEQAQKLGVRLLADIPLLDAEVEPKNTNEALSRLFAMTAVAAACYGFDKSKAKSWLMQEGLIDFLTTQELQFVSGGMGDIARLRAQIEAMWTLSWATGFVEEMDFGKDCDNRFATMLPNLKQSQSCETFRKKATHRPVEQLVIACDLAYCLHWAIRQNALTGKPEIGSLKQYVIVERRRALEWLLSQDKWDDVHLDT